MNQASESAVSPVSHLPAGLKNAFIFAVFNALSFQMVVGNPMILYAKTLGASATTLGLIAGMLPLLNIFQIPAARHVDRIGHKRFVLAGWSTRVLFVFLMALVPLAGGFLTTQTTLALLLFLLFAFNLSRGISVCGWLPWITGVIPPNLRGRFLVLEGASVNAASFVAFCLAAFALGRTPAGWQFALLFGFSALAGASSLHFLKRIPEATPPRVGVSRSTESIPWRAIAAHPPFRKLLRMNAAFSLAAGGVTAFSTAFLKVWLDLPESEILLIAAVSFLGGLSSLGLLKRRLDQFGSKPVLILFHLVWLVILSGWAMVAMGLIPPWRMVLVGLQFLMGMAFAAVQMANMRLVMATIPEMGRSHFFALQSVISNVVLGISPVVWGLGIDLLTRFEIQAGMLSLNRYAWYFCGALLVFVVSLCLCRPLEEPEAQSTEAMLQDMLTHSRLRAWLRLWPRA